MKKLVSFVTMLGCMAAGAQEKTTYSEYEKLIDIKGTAYVIATAAAYEKGNTTGKFILFIDTNTGTSQRVDFPETFTAKALQQIKIDSLGVNLILIRTRLDVERKLNKDWTDPSQLVLFSPSGKQRTVVTGERFITNVWEVKPETGKLVIAGYQDNNSNGRYDRGDKEEILIYDLVQMKHVSRL